ncbi:MAG: TolC family protein [Dissulfurispiraceae bacterium]|jgi:outer membrane protein, heavy metal efflux system
MGKYSKSVICGSLKQQRLLITLSCLFIITISVFSSSKVHAEDLNLKQLIDEALRNSPELQASRSRTAASEYRIPQVKTLPDPMFSFGYQNVGFQKYTYGQDNDAWWMFSVSQTVPFPGKLSLKGDIASRESESIYASQEAMRLKTISRVKELYFDLYTTYKDIDLIHERTSLLNRVEDAALSRYSTGKGSQQEVLMAQTEKYMLLEKEEMLKQKIQSLEAMLNSVIGRSAEAPLGRPADTQPSVLTHSLNDLIKIAYAQSPEIEAKNQTIAAAEAKVSLAKKDYIPDFTITGSYFPRGNDFGDMWSLQAAINIPIFYRTKQRHAENEANALLAEARSEQELTRLIISSAIKDNYSMVQATDKLMALYQDGLIPKSRQDVELALSGYMTGSVDALTVITRLKSVIDFEISYWNQFAEHEKAVAKLEAIAGLSHSTTNSQTGN